MQQKYPEWFRLAGLANSFFTVPTILYCAFTDGLVGHPLLVPVYLTNAAFFLGLAYFSYRKTHPHDDR